MHNWYTQRIEWTDVILPKFKKKLFPLNKRSESTDIKYIALKKLCKKLLTLQTIQILDFGS